ncbi:choice-of-anchor M domain-containing protein [Streptomyces sp. WMMC500]|uniref:choice-of-anchor M domain-containing protein n=1 Tax=Streptomyces sp. WMMC500 TaxID=3015154 RepID=UPI00248BAC4C|nr:choice-of-anchor M domain-containing protein [Streptomyces sp. WMMC500]WBB63383.1 choice-of-anchor M domain-containing protein [Streptomyces sp. WMMC500]
MRATNRPVRVLAALVLAAAGLVSVGAAGGGDGDAAPVTPPAASVAASAAGDVVDERTVIDRGHVDAVAPRLVDGEFRTLLKDSREPANVIWREPTSVVMHLTPAGRQTIPDPAGGLAYIGEPGDVFHLIPQAQDPEVLWAGWNTEEFAAADLDGRLKLSLDEVEGPGSLVVWAWSTFGEPLPRFDTRDGLPDGYDVPGGTHEHANWAFTEEGVYRMTFTFSATLASGEEVSDSQVFTMAVGDIDPDDVTLPGDGGGSSDGGTSDGGTTDGGTTDGGADDGGTSDGGSGGDGGSSDGGTADGGSGGTTDAGSSDGGSSGGGTSGSSGGVTAAGASVGEGTDGGGSSGGDTGAAGVAGGSDGGAAKGGGLASTGSAGVLPLAVASAALIAVGAGGFVYVNRRRARPAGGDVAADTARA